MYKAPSMKNQKALESDSDFLEGKMGIPDPANPDTVYVPEVNSINSILTVSE